MIYSIFSWLLQVAKGFFNYWPIYREAKWIIIIFSSNHVLSIWSCLLFNRKPLSNQKTRSLGRYSIFCTANKITPLIFSKYITGNHCIKTMMFQKLPVVFQKLHQIHKIPVLCTFGKNSNQKPCYSNSYLKEPGHI